MWQDGFDSVLELWREVAPELLPQTGQASQELGRNPRALGKSRNHWEQPPLQGRPVTFRKKEPDACRVTRRAEGLGPPGPSAAPLSTMRCPRNINFLILCGDMSEPSTVSLMSLANRFTSGFGWHALAGVAPRHDVRIEKDDIAGAPAAGGWYTRRCHRQDSVNGHSMLLFTECVSTPVSRSEVARPSPQVWG
jgi:hypothetical protein